MVFVRETSANVFVELDTTQSILVQSNGNPDVINPPQILTEWTEEQLNAIDIYLVTPYVPAPNVTITGDPHYSRVDGVVIQTYDVVDIVVTVPTSITRRQLIIAMFATDYITAEEAIAAASIGAAPIFLRGYLNSFPEPEKTLAYVTWASMSVCERNSIMLTQMLNSVGLTQPQMDDYFIWAATL